MHLETKFLCDSLYSNVCFIVVVLEPNPQYLWGMSVDISLLNFF